MATRFWYASLLPVVAACSSPRLVVGGGGDSGCVPGVYAGTFDCTAGTKGSGPLSIQLDGDMGGQTLAVAPGAKISTGEGGTVYSVDLSGTLDCTTNRLKGTLQNSRSVGGSINVTLNGTGTISADYDASASPPALVGGMFSQPGYSSVSGACTWSAVLQ